ncbi:hypothetical protein [Alkalihalobacterium chitinilyticum]|uniref:Sporulation histidine kinase inhibitor Sda n=1 Tax=Alkalihalobacterium chitinilyticum TaxID=2980103 RepID=A0ABT5VH12_9BACI|nr:hypothetical protein [Alkalihalobacterium chitinilyticum]MDE5414027.1 hypothetical protein [Alkalihalobacterium chitinilyticum]
MSKQNPLLDILLEAYRKGEKEGTELQDLMKEIEKGLRVFVDEPVK